MFDGYFAFFDLLYIGCVICPKISPDVAFDFIDVLVNAFLQDGQLRVNYKVSLTLRIEAARVTTQTVYFLVGLEEAVAFVYNPFRSGR